GTDTAINWPQVPNVTPDRSNPGCIGIADETPRPAGYVDTNLTITNNILVNCVVGIWSWMDQPTIYRGWTIANNTIVNCSNGGIKLENYRGTTSGLIQNMTVRNNVVIGKAGEWATMDVYPSWTNPVIGKNIYYGLNTFFYGGSFLDFPGWASATGDANSA